MIWSKKVAQYVPSEANKTKDEISIKKTIDFQENCSIFVSK